MNTLRVLFARLALLGGILGLAACRGPAEPGDPAAAASDTPIDTVRISMGSGLISMDPYAKLESVSFSILRNVFDPLVDLGPNLELNPALATEWTHEGPCDWRFAIRPGVTFHNGKALTAEDAAYSIRRAMEWPLSRVKSEIATIDSVEALDPLTLRVTTAEPDAILPLRLAMILIMDAETTRQAIEQHGEAWLATHPNGTGPYRLEQWQRDQHCTLEASGAYWGEAPAIERLVFLPTADSAARMAALSRGELDILVDLPPRFVKQAEAITGVNVHKQAGFRVIYLGLDCGRAESPGILEPEGANPLADVRVRRAIALAIDNALIVRTIMGGNAVPADQLLPPGVAGHLPDFLMRRPDLDEARRLLAEAGYPEGFAVRLDGPNDRYVNDAQVAQAIASMLARVGIRVEVDVRPKASFFADEEQGRCSFFLIGWANTNGDGAPTFAHLLHTPDAGAGLGTGNSSTHYHNPALDELTSRIAGEFDPQRRQAMLQQAHRMVLEDLPHVPLHFQMDIFAVSERIDWTPRRDTQVRGLDIAPAR